MLEFDYFKLFGLTPTYQQDVTLLKTRYLELQQKMHPDNFVNALAHEKQLAVTYAAAVNQAFKVLACPLQRAIYLLKLQGIDTQSETDTQMPMDFLVEQMELREALEEVADESAREKVAQKIHCAWQQCEESLATALDEIPKEFSVARLWVRKMQFYARLREEVQLCLS